MQNPTTNMDAVISALKAYPGKPDGGTLKIMEVCGTHTAAIFKKGIRDLISPKIKLISGPGCPVCVTPTAYIDRCIDFAKKPGHVLLTYGDMMKVPGTVESLSSSMGQGAKVQLMYSPFDGLDVAEGDPSTTVVIGAVGFETIVPAYGLLMEEAKRRGITNLILLTAIKTVLPALDFILDSHPDIDGFMLPGHVSVILGSDAYEPLARKYHKPMVVAGFEAEHLLGTLYRIAQQVNEGRGEVENLYPEAVHPRGNERAQEVMNTWFEPGTAMWRGLGNIPDSGLYLRDGDISRGLTQDKILPAACRCGEVIVGAINPDECPMFGNECHPGQPYGPCMVSTEGACGIWFRNRRVHQG